MKEKFTKDTSDNKVLAQDTYEGAMGAIEDFDFDSESTYVRFDKDHASTIAEKRNELVQNRFEDTTSDEAKAFLNKVTQDLIAFLTPDRSQIDMGGVEEYFDKKFNEGDKPYTGNEFIDSEGDIERRPVGIDEFNERMQYDFGVTIPKFHYPSDFMGPDLAERIYGGVADLQTEVNYAIADAYEIYLRRLKKRGKKELSRKVAQSIIESMQAELLQDAINNSKELDFTADREALQDKLISAFAESQGEVYNTSPLGFTKVSQRLGIKESDIYRDAKEWGITRRGNRSIGPDSYEFADQDALDAFMKQYDDRQNAFYQGGNLEQLSGQPSEKKLSKEILSFDGIATQLGWTQKQVLDAARLNSLVRQRNNEGGYAFPSANSIKSLEKIVSTRKGEPYPDLSPEDYRESRGFVQQFKVNPLKYDGFREIALDNSEAYKNASLVFDELTKNLPQIMEDQQIGEPNNNVIQFNNFGEGRQQLKADSQARVAQYREMMPQIIDIAMKSFGKEIATGELSAQDLGATLMSSDREGFQLRRLVGAVDVEANKKMFEYSLQKVGTKGIAREVFIDHLQENDHILLDDDGEILWFDFHRIEKDLEKIVQAEQSKKLSEVAGAVKKREGPSEIELRKARRAFQAEEKEINVVLSKYPKLASFIFNLIEIHRRRFGDKEIYKLDYDSAKILQRKIEYPQTLREITGRDGVLGFFRSDPDPMTVEEALEKVGLKDKMMVVLGAMNEKAEVLQEMLKDR